MKIGLVKNWDGPRRRFIYLFTPGDNDTRMRWIKLTRKPV